MHKFIFLLFLVSVVGCGADKKIKFYPAQEAELQKIVNDKDIYESPNLSLDKTIVNNDYPIEIALYQDKKFFYNLPNLGSGRGEWSYANGYLKLKAKRKIFDILIEVRSLDEASKQLAIAFVDRFGPNVLKVQKENID